MKKWADIIYGCPLIESFIGQVNNLIKIKNLKKYNMTIVRLVSGEVKRSYLRSLKPKLLFFIFIKSTYQSAFMENVASKKAQWVFFKYDIFESSV